MLAICLACTLGSIGWRCGWWHPPTHHTDCGLQQEAPWCDRAVQNNVIWALVLVREFDRDDQRMVFQTARRERRAGDRPPRSEGMHGPLRCDQPLAAREERPLARFGALRRLPRGGVHSQGLCQGGVDEGKQDGGEMVGIRCGAPRGGCICAE